MLQGGGHHAVHAFQTLRRKQLYEQHAQHHSKYSTALSASQTASGIDPTEWREKSSCHASSVSFNNFTAVGFNVA